MIEGTQEIIFNGHELSEYGCIISEPPKRPFPKRITEKKSVYGRNGALVIDSGAYGNISVVYKVATIPGLYGGRLIDEVLTDLKAAFCTSAEYVRLYDTELPGGFYLAFCSGISDAVQTFEDMYEFSITFDCKPFFYLEIGQEIITKQLTDGAGMMLCNPGTVPAKPVIKLYGSGTLTCYVRGKRFAVNDVSDNVTVDSERMLVYKGGTDMADNFEGEYPEMLPGNNLLGFSGAGIISAEIIPRWCRL